MCFTPSTQQYNIASVAALRVTVARIPASRTDGVGVAAPYIQGDFFYHDPTRISMKI